MNLGDPWFSFGRPKVKMGIKGDTEAHLDGTMEVGSAGSTPSVGKPRNMGKRRSRTLLLFKETLSRTQKRRLSVNWIA